MGVSKYISLTPYLEVTGDKEVDEPKIRRFCPDHPNKDQKNAKFCSECGQLVQHEDVPHIVTYNPVSYIFNKLKLVDTDELCSVGENNNVLVSNKSMPKDIEFEDVDEWATQAISLCSPDDLIKINKQMEWFKEEHHEAIEAIKQKFGEDNVAVKWGVIHYWS